MTTSPFFSLYFSNLSCGTSSATGLTTAFWARGVSADFGELCAADCDGAGFCPAEVTARVNDAAAPISRTRLSNTFMRVSFQIAAHPYRLMLNRWTTLAGVPRNLHLAYLGSE